MAHESVNNGNLNAADRVRGLVVEISATIEVSRNYQASQDFFCVNILIVKRVAERYGASIVINLWAVVEINFLRPRGNLNADQNQ